MLSFTNNSGLCSTIERAQYEGTQRASRGRLSGEECVGTLVEGR